MRPTPETPALVAAQFALGLARLEKVPWRAADWLAAGHDGPALRELAGLNGRDPVTVAELLPAALAETGTVVPVRVKEAANEIFRHLATICLAGEAPELWVGQQIGKVLRMSDYSAEVLGSPLGELYDIEDEWSGVWGRSDQQLAALVRAACEEQLRSGNSEDLGAAGG